MYYFFSPKFAILKVDGEIIGTLGNKPLLCPKSKITLAEIIPNGQLPLYVIPDYFVSHPNVKKYPFGDDELFVIEKFENYSKSFNTLYSNAVTVFGEKVNVDVICDCNDKLLVQTSRSLKIENLPASSDNVEIKELYSSNGNYFLIDVIIPSGRILYCYKLNASELSLCFKQAINDYKYEKLLSTAVCVDDLQKHTIIAEWQTGEPFSLITHSVTPTLPQQTFAEKDIPLLAFERLSAGGSVREFLGDNIIDKASLLSNYVGKFEYVFQSPATPYEIITIGGEKVKKFSVQVENRKIFNITMLEN